MDVKVIKLLWNLYSINFQSSLTHLAGWRVIFLCTYHPMINENKICRGKNLAEI